jgi:hypothetical protein
MTRRSKLRAPDPERRRPSVRRTADAAKRVRCRTLTCVLENPNNPGEAQDCVVVGHGLVTARA